MYPESGMCPPPSKLYLFIGRWIALSIDGFCYKYNRTVSDLGEKKGKRQTTTKFRIAGFRLFANSVIFATGRPVFGAAFPQNSHF